MYNISTVYKSSHLMSDYNIRRVYRRLNMFQIKTVKVGLAASFRPRGSKDFLYCIHPRLKVGSAYLCRPLIYLYVL